MPPWPGPARPLLVEPPFEQGCDRERERHREADVADVEHRRVEGERRVLQQRVQVASVNRGRYEPLERARGEQDEQQEADANDAEHADYAGRVARGQAAAESADQHGPARQREGPEQQRTLVRAPYRGEAIERGQLGVRVVGDVLDREVVLVERPAQRREGQRHEHPLSGDGRPRSLHPAPVAHVGAGKTEPRLGDCQQQRHDEREKPQFYDHSILPRRVALRCPGSCPTPPGRGASGCP